MSIENSETEVKETKKRAKKDIPFEDAMKRLEEIVSELEKGTAPLDKSLEMFEEGVRLVKLCGEKLDSAEQKISMLVKNNSGDYEYESKTSEDF